MKLSPLPNQLEFFMARTVSRFLFLPKKLPQSSQNAKLMENKVWRWWERVEILQKWTLKGDFSSEGSTYWGWKNIAWADLL